MNIYKITTPDVCNGTGCRVSMWVTGCTHHCPECFNNYLWDKNVGTKFNEEIKQQLFNELDHDYIAGLSVLGGEPLQQGAELAELLKEISERFPSKDIWLWTGYDMDELNEDQKQTISYCSHVVTGRFVKAKHDIGLKWRGSTNQYVWKRNSDNTGFYIVES